MVWMIREKTPVAYVSKQIELLDQLGARTTMKVRVKNSPASYLERSPPCLPSYLLFLCHLISVLGNCILVFYYNEKKYFQDAHSCALELVVFKGQTC